MACTIKVIKKGDQVTNLWSGGTTTQIAIYPEDSDYGKRNFKWRLSSAKVNMEESTFTYLKGIQRIIMIIKGEMFLKHMDHHSILLKQFEQDSFKGEWTTQSIGKVRDFNLMMAEGYAGKLAAVKIKKNSFYELSDKGYKIRANENLWQAFYSVDSSITLKLDGREAFKIQEGDLILIHRQNTKEKIHITIFNNGENDADIIESDIYDIG